jgi:hypothetical protein
LTNVECGFALFSDFDFDEFGRAAFEDATVRDGRFVRRGPAKRREDKYG